MYNSSLSYYFFRVNSTSSPYGRRRVRLYQLSPPKICRSKSSGVGDSLAHSRLNAAPYYKRTECLFLGQLLDDQLGPNIQAENSGFRRPNLESWRWPYSTILEKYPLYRYCISMQYLNITLERNLENQPFYCLSELCLTRLWLDFESNQHPQAITNLDGHHARGLITDITAKISWLRRTEPRLFSQQ